MASADLLLWLVVLFPPVWYLCYTMAKIEEKKAEAAVSKIVSKISFVEAMSKPSVLLFSVYLTIAITAFETAYSEILAFYNLLLYKFFIGVAAYLLGRWVVVYGMRTPRLAFAIYAALPWSGSITNYKKNPFSLFTAPLLIACVLIAMYKTRPKKEVEKKTAQQTQSKGYEFPLPPPV